MIWELVGVLKEKPHDQADQDPLDSVSQVCSHTFLSSLTRSIALQDLNLNLVFLSHLLGITDSHQYTWL